MAATGSHFNKKLSFLSVCLFGRVWRPGGWCAEESRAATLSVRSLLCGAGPQIWTERTKQYYYSYILNILPLSLVQTNHLDRL